jgi:hypothetical protein
LPCIQKDLLGSLLVVVVFEGGGGLEDLTFYRWQCWRLKPVRQHIVFLMMDVLKLHLRE